MERLTKRKGETAIFEHQSFQLKLCGSCKTEDCQNCVVNSVTERLAAYKDTNLTPEEVADLAAAKREGRLVVLPCKEGDTVYWCGTYRGKIRIVEYKVESVTIFNKGFYLSCGRTIVFWDNEVGKTVFLTSAEAEAALATQSNT